MEEGTKLSYCNLDTRDGNNNYIVNQLSGRECLPNEVSAYGNQVIYYAELGEKSIVSEKAVFIQTLEGDSNPTPLSDIKGNVYSLYDKFIYYVDVPNICRYNIANKEIEILFNFENLGIDFPPTRIASNGKDIVFNNQKAAYWLAGISNLEILEAKQIMLKGSKLPIKGRATYSNKFSEDVSQAGKWTSSNSSVAKIEGHDLLAVSAGVSTISWEYKGEKTSFALTVKEKLGLELAYDNLEVDLGENIKMQAFLKYSDGSYEDISELSTWQSQINEIKDGIYYAHNPGKDIITVSYEGFTTSLGIIINPPTIPEPTPNYKKSSPNRKAEIPDKELLTLQIQGLEVIKYISDYNKLMRLFSPHGFLGEIIEDYQKGTLFTRFKHMPEPHVMGIVKHGDGSPSNTGTVLRLGPDVIPSNTGTVLRLGPDVIPI
ncbi:MAG TPA: hypothetical protein VFD02_04330 [Syntrophomonadaceae bacterium]|nr:hypothetical protein [Syntrophomonadaceae bacterium]